VSGVRGMIDFQCFTLKSSNSIKECLAQQGIKRKEALTQWPRHPTTDPKYGSACWIGL